MQHARFLQKQRLKLIEEKQRLLLQCEEVDKRIGFIDEMLEEDELDAELEYSLIIPTDKIQRSRMPVRNLLIEMLQGGASHQLTLEQMMEQLRLKGHTVAKGTLQSVLSRNKDDFESINKRIGQWTLTEKHLPLQSREDNYLESLPTPYPPQIHSMKYIEAETGREFSVDHMLLPSGDYEREGEFPQDGNEAIVDDEDDNNW